MQIKTNDAIYWGFFMVGAIATHLVAAGIGASNLICLIAAVAGGVGCGFVAETVYKQMTDKQGRG